MANSQLDSDHLYSQIFESRFTLKYKSMVIQCMWEESFSKPRKILVVTLGMITCLLFIKNLILICALPELTSYSSEKVQNEIIICSLLILLNFILVCIQFINRVWEYLSKKSFFHGFIFISLGLYINLLVSFSRDVIHELDNSEEKDYPARSFILLSFLFILRLFYMLTFDHFTNFFFVGIISMIVEMIESIFIFQKNYLSYTFSSIIFLATLILIAYAKDFYLRVHFFISVHKSDKCVIEATPVQYINHSYFSVNPITRFFYKNNCAHNLITLFKNVFAPSTGKKETVLHISNSEKKSNNNQPPLSLDYWRILKKNLIVFHQTLDGTETNSEIKYLERIINNIVYVNKELQSGIFQYFTEIKNSHEAKNIPSDLKNSFDIIDFSFGTFLKILCPEKEKEKEKNKEKEKAQETKKVKEKIIEPRKLKGLAGLSGNKSVATCDITGCTHLNVNQSQSATPMTNLLPLINDDLAQLNTSYPKIIKTTRRRSSTRKPALHYEYVYIGKILLKLRAKRPTIQLSENINFRDGMYQKTGIFKEFYLFYRYDAKIGYIEILIEDFNEILAKERSDTIVTCRSLYLSKIAHEFNNPVCNILEMVNVISDDINMEKTLPDDNGFFFNSERDQSEKNSKISWVNKIYGNITSLRNLIQMMIFVIKDFNFYSQLSEDEADGAEALTNNNSDDVKQSPFQAQHSPPIKPPCEHKKIIQELITMFTKKSSERKEGNELRFILDFRENLPEVIDFDKEIFSSLLFNLLYQAYKSLQYGEVRISVSNNEVNSLRSKDESISRHCQLLYEISISGVIRFGGLGNMFIKESIYKKMICENLDDEITEENNSKSMEQNEISSRKDKEKDKEESAMRNLALSLTVHQASIESFHIKNIFNIIDLRERDSVIEEFNNNFGIYISQIYAKRLGSKVEIDQNEKSPRIFFYLDTVEIKKSVENQMLSGRRNYTNLNLNQIQIYKQPSEGSNSDLIINNFLPTNNPLQGRVVEVKTINHMIRDVNIKGLRSLPVGDERNKSMSSKRTVKKSCDFYFNYDANGFLNNNHVSSESIYEVDQPYNSKIPCKRQRSLGDFIQQTLKIRSGSANEELRMNREGGKDENRQKTNDNKNKTTTKLFLLNKKASNESSINLNTLTLDKMGKEPAQDKAKKDKDDSSTLKGKIYRVLLTDDEPLVRSSLTRFFKSLAKELNIVFEVHQAENGFECLNTLYCKYNEGKQFDVIVIDENMPYMKGSQVINLIKGMINNGDFMNIIIISYTAYDSNEKKKIILSQGADFILNKPIKYDDFKLFFLESVFKK